MGDPLVAPAVVGAAVSAFFTMVIDAAKCELGHRKKCKLLLESANKLQPHIDAAYQHSPNWEKAQCDALEEIKIIWEKARSFGTKGANESKSEWGKRAMMFWRWGKLPAEHMDIIGRIEEAKNNVLLCAAVQYLKDVNSAKTRTSSGFLGQQIPTEIVGVDIPFNKLKASILESYAKDMASHLGLHGRGGAGKTLLAKMLHNDRDIKERYGVDSIKWITVGLNARVLDLYKTMATFLEDARFEQSYGHRSLEDQRSYLIDAFKEKKVVLVLDDVWQEGGEQNHAIMYWLNIVTAPGSVTLITTRNVAIFSEVYADSEIVLSLSEDDSWELFCSHAFLNSTPPQSIPVELAKEVCQECQGLPLALKVVGSSMKDKVSKEEWDHALNSLKQSKTILGSPIDHELFGRLRWSYDMLQGNVLKTCFLYFAAFPEDYEISVTKLFQMWISEGLVDTEDEAMDYLEVLEKRSLIEWNHSGGHAKVHDILRDLALMIIENAEVGESAYECFFASGKVLKAFPRRKSSQAIKRMSLINNTIYQSINNLQLPHLQVCLLSGLNGSIDQISNIFSNLEKTNLKYLDFSHNQFNFQEMVPCMKLSTYLTHLDLSCGQSLQQLPQQIGELKALINLDLSGCSSLQQLPQQIGQLRALINFRLSRCSSLQQLPQQIGELKALTRLDLSECSSLQQLPHQIGELKALTYLHLSECSSLQQLPQQIGELKALRCLRLLKCSSLQQFPQQIGELKALRFLELSGCSSVQQLPHQIAELEALTCLHLSGNSSLRQLPYQIGELKTVTFLDLSRCSSLQQLPQQIGELKALKYLVLNGCSSLQQLPHQIGELKALTHLDLSKCSSLQQLPHQIGELKALTYLHLSGTSSLQQLPHQIGELKALTHLDLSKCSSLQQLPHQIGELKALTYLHLSGTSSLQQLPHQIGELKALTLLDVSDCSSLLQLPHQIGELKAVTHFHLRRNSSLRQLPHQIGELKALRNLYLNGCSSLQQLPHQIGDLNALRNLNLNGCSSLVQLPQLIGELKALTNLTLLGCSSLQKLPQQIGELKALRELNLTGCSSLQQLPQQIGELKALTNLTLLGCSSLQKLPQQIGELKALRELNLTGCSSLQQLPQQIGELKALTNLTLLGCSSLQQLPQRIGKLKALTGLNLSRCSSLQQLPHQIGELKALTKLDLSECSSLQQLPQQIREMKALIELNLSGYSSLEKLPQ